MNARLSSLAVSEIFCVCIARRRKQSRLRGDIVIANPQM